MRVSTCHWLRIRPLIQPARLYSTAANFHCVDVLPTGSVDAFRQQAFTPQIPALLPRGYFCSIPALSKWFRPSPNHDDTTISELNDTYLSTFSQVTVPLELTKLKPSASASPFSPLASSNEDTFSRFHAPLHLFLSWTKHASATPTTASRLYLAQAQLLDLPQPLRDDLPTPDIVTQAGRGDVYDTNIWIGIPPTNTPLHRDPNPNLFVQLAGEKIVRLFEPDVGGRLFERVRMGMGTGTGTLGEVRVRGEEMMRGEEKRLLDGAVWGDGPEEGGVKEGSEVYGYEARVGAGDGLFIPRGWWHSVKGVGKGVTGSVNWWFR